jgi:hypothetical protein
VYKVASVLPACVFSGGTTPHDNLHHLHHLTNHLALKSHYCLIVNYLFRLPVCSCTYHTPSFAFVRLILQPPTMFFKRLSRSRSNSQSYIDTNYSSHDNKNAYDDDYDNRPDSARGPPTKSASLNDGAMFAQQQPQSIDNFNAPPMSRQGPQMSNGFGPAKPASVSAPQPEAMPDLLTRAFNEAVRPYTNRVEELENEVADLKAWIEQLEAQRREVHAWIDKRGLRPGTLLLLLCIVCAFANYS